MPDHIQARTDNMPDAPKGKNRWVGKVVIGGIFVGLIALLAFAA